MTESTELGAEPKISLAKWTASCKVGNDVNPGLILSSGCILVNISYTGSRIITSHDFIVNT